MIFLVDYNLDGYALVFLGLLTKQGWLEFMSIQFVTFREAGLSMNSSDRIVWNYAQENQMIILTANRNMKGDDSLEEVMRKENTATSFPVVTIGNLDRFDEFDCLKSDPNSYKTVLDNIYYLAGQFRGFAFTINFETFHSNRIEPPTTGNKIFYIIVLSTVFVVGLFVGLLVDFSKIRAPKIDGKLINPIPYKWQVDETNRGRAYQVAADLYCRYTKQRNNFYADYSQPLPKARATKNVSMDIETFQPIENTNEGMYFPRIDCIKAQGSERTFSPPKYNGLWIDPVTSNWRNPINESNAQQARKTSALTFCQSQGFRVVNQENFENAAIKAPKPINSIRMNLETGEGQRKDNGEWDVQKYNGSDQWYLTNVTCQKE